MNQQERLQRAIAQDQMDAAVLAWHDEPEADSPRRARLAARVTHWKRVLDALAAF